MTVGQHSTVVKRSLTIETLRESLKNTLRGQKRVLKFQSKIEGNYSRSTDFKPASCESLNDLQNTDSNDNTS